MDYISKKIPISDIPKWVGGKVLISAQTGTGKSHFIKNNLLQYAKDNNLKILLLSNRLVLRSQNEEELVGEREHIQLVNYQKIETDLISDTEILEYYIRNFDIVVCDEFHYVFSDAEFNRRTDLMLELLTGSFENKMMIFITATPELILSYYDKFDHRYTMKKNYSYIEKVYFYKKDSSPEAIIQNIPGDEKIIYFTSDANEGYALAQKFDDSAFICGDSNPLARYSSSSVYSDIVEKAFFQPRLLVATKVLDNGVNIVDESVRHIIIDMLDLQSLIQCLGRKRITSPRDTIKVYIKDYHGGLLFFNQKTTEQILLKAEQLEERGVDDFIAIHRKRQFHDIVDNDFQINKAKKHYYEYKARFLERIRKSKTGFRDEVISYLQIPEDRVADADNEFEKINIKAYLSGLVNHKMFKDQQEVFKTIFFGLLFSPKNTNYRNRGIRSINSILEEDNIPYRVTSGKENKGDKRNQRWWAVISMDNFIGDET